MANEEGTPLLGFGTDDITGYVTQEIAEPQSGEDLTIYDYQGDPETHLSGYAIERNVTLTLIPKSGTSVPAIGDVFTYDSQTFGATQKFTVLSIDPTESNRDVPRWTISGKAFPVNGITLT